MRDASSFAMKTTAFAITFAVALISSHPFSVYAAGEHKRPISYPLDPSALKERLSLARGSTTHAGSWPRLIQYRSKAYDFTHGTLREEWKHFSVSKKPSRIIAHSIGVTEILWAICPRERIVAVTELVANPAFSFIADEVRQKAYVGNLHDAELVLGCKPDLVFTVFYSGVEFKKKLLQARVPVFDLGYFGSIESIREQILLLGQVIGEEGNAAALVRTIDDAIEAIRRKRPQTSKPCRILYLDQNSYVPGTTSNFSSLCELIGAINVAEEQGAQAWTQVDYETILKWDPDIILFSSTSSVGRMIANNRVLARSRAVRAGKLFPIDGVYIAADSQYMVLSANALAGIVYEEQDASYY